MYHTIINPLTNRKVSIHSKIGKTVLKNYINNYMTQMNGGGTLDVLLDMPESGPTFKPSYCDGLDKNGTQCFNPVDGDLPCVETPKLVAGNLYGGNYPGYCDSNTTQCMDTVVTNNCNSGGGKKN